MSAVLMFYSHWCCFCNRALNGYFRHKHGTRRALYAGRYTYSESPSQQVLYNKALKPGGIYFIEDIQIARSPGYVDTSLEQLNTLDMIKDFVEEVARDSDLNDMVPAAEYYTKYRYPSRLRSIECSSEVCAFIKCLHDDDRCPSPPSRNKHSYGKRDSTGV